MFTIVNCRGCLTLGSVGVVHHCELSGLFADVNSRVYAVLNYWIVHRCEMSGMFIIQNSGVFAVVGCLVVHCCELTGLFADVNCHGC